jgi:hypothetical protein
MIAIDLVGQGFTVWVSWVSLAFDTQDNTQVFVGCNGFLRGFVKLNFQKNPCVTMIAGRS